MAAGAARRLGGHIAIAALLAFPGTALAAAPGFAPLDLHTTRIDRFKIGSTETKFGALEFRGGLELTSRNADFGALSGLDFAPDGTLLGVADTGFWFTARPVEEDGQLIGLTDGRLAPILDANGVPVASKREGDAEGLRIVEREGRLEALVSFEQRNDLRRYVAAPDFAQARPQPIPLPKSIGGINRNGGLEAIAVAPAGGSLEGAIVLVAEHALDKNGNHRAWIVGGPRPGAFAIVRSDEFDVTDADFLPNGDLLILERRFNFSVGVGMRIRRIAAAAIAAGKTVDGQTLIDADMRYQIDNMEGMALRTAPGGETLVTLCSDDNDSIIQRTILLQFALPPDTPPTPRPRPALDH
jgi:hypothetical protein